MKVQVWRKEQFLVSTDSALLDMELVHQELSSSYWSKGIPRFVVEKSVRHSLCFGIFVEDGSSRLKQVGFARVVSDYSTFAYLGDVFVVDGYKKRGLSKWLMECVLAHPELQGLRRFCLGTKDAQSLYSRYGFQVIKEPGNWMEIKVPGIYERNSEA